MPKLDGAINARDGVPSKLPLRSLDSSLDSSIEVTIHTPPDLEPDDPEAAQERLFAFGDRVAERTGMTRADIEEAVRDRGADMKIGDNITIVATTRPRRWKR